MWYLIVLIPDLCNLITLKLAGIDLSLFTPHSTRSASTSAVVSKVPIDTIIKTAGWSKAPDKDWKQLGIYPPLFGLIGYFKF